MAIVAIAKAPLTLHSSLCEHYLVCQHDVLQRDMEKAGQAAGSVPHPVGEGGGGGFAAAWQNMHLSDERSLRSKPFPFLTLAVGSLAHQTCTWRRGRGEGGVVGTSSFLSQQLPREGFRWLRPIHHNVIHLLQQAQCHSEYSLRYCQAYRCP